jgi:hypothetical protein
MNERAIIRQKINVPANVVVAQRATHIVDRCCALVVITAKNVVMPAQMIASDTNKPTIIPFISLPRTSAELSLAG